MECVLKNNKGLFFDLVNIKSLEEDWFNWGEGKVIFNNKDELIDKIKKILKEKLIDKEFGNGQIIKIFWIHIKIIKEVREWVII